MSNMNRMIRAYRMEGIKARFAQIWKDINVLITECENEKMEDKVLEEILTCRALASAGEQTSLNCVRTDKKLLEIESGD